MADTAERLFRLLALLQRRPVWTGADLAETLGVEPRTVRRDVERLRCLGYVVDSTPGTAGGYRLGVGNDLPPLQLDDDEAMAVAVLLGVSATSALPGIERAALATLARIDRLLPPRLRGPVAALRASTDALVTPQDVVPTGNLVLLAEACDAVELVAFVYKARNGRESTRRAEPHRLVTTDRRWYLVAWDLDRRDWRTFRVDRISGARRTGHTFVPRPLDDPARFVAEAIAVTPWEWQAVVHVHAPLAEVARRVPVSVGCVAESGEHTRLSVGGDSLEWLAGFLAGLGLPFVVESPEALRLHLVDLGRQFVAAHG